jgi:hypothetical protein
MIYLSETLPIGGDKMSLEDLNKKELESIVAEFVLEADDGATEDELRETIQSSRVTDSEIALSFPNLAEKLDAEDDEDEEEGGLISSGSIAPKKTAKKAAKKAPAKRVAAKTVVDDGTTLLKMTRNNPVYEVRGYRFEREHPYVLVKDEDVDFLIEIEGGFTVAKKSEVESFYN